LGSSGSAWSIAHTYEPDGDGADDEEDAGDRGSGGASVEPADVANASAAPASAAAGGAATPKAPLSAEDADVEEGLRALENGLASPSLLFATVTQQPQPSEGEAVLGDTGAA
jgi:hypothetical protein